MKIKVISYVCSFIFIISSISILAVKPTSATVISQTPDGISCVLNQINISTLENVQTTNYYGSDTYHAGVSPISEFFDIYGNYNIVYEGANKIYIAKLDSNMELTTTLTLKMQYPIFGGAACDSSGNYYIVWGQNDTQGSGQAVTICVSKYDTNGTFIGNVLYKGSETWDSNWGTQYPFDSGNCSVTIKNNILVCSYARQMYNGCQSNYVIYVNCTTMKKLNIVAPYSSHSFDQQVIAVQSGGYLFVDQSDAYDRGFVISKVSKGSDGLWGNDKFDSFHFREGANRDFGYNETYSQLGGIAEASTGYVLAGSSEKTLSYNTAPTNQCFCGHSEARNLFIQIIKKDFGKYSNSGKYLTNGNVRTATGTAPANADTKLWLAKGTADYGVEWLTSYSNEYFVANPKVIVTNDDKIVILWEKMKYGTTSCDEYISTNLVVLSNTGEILFNPVVLPSVRLTSNEAPVYKNGNIYWTTSTGTSKMVTLNILRVSIDNNNKSLLKSEGAVSFNSQGGSTVPNISFNSGNTILEPAAPVKTGFSFAGWYKEASCTNKWNFSTEPVTENITLYAKWIPAMPSEPSVPSNVIAVSTINNSIKLSWKTVCGATGYVVYRFNTIKKAYEKIKVTSASNFLNSMLDVNQIYSYKVRAYQTVNSSNQYSGFSATASCKPVFSAPSDFSAARLSNTSVTLHWNAVPGATGYEIYRYSANTGTYNLIKTLTSTSLINTGLADNTTYYYKMRAVTSAANEKISSAFTAIKYATT